jgi:hypothetical protein
MVSLATCDGRKTEKAQPGVCTVAKTSLETIMRRLTLLILVFLASVSLANAGWRDYLDSWLGDSKSSAPASTAAKTGSAYEPSGSDMNKAILDALSVGIQRAIKLLGTKNGFLNDAQVRIPMPKDLQNLEAVLRKLGQDKYADQFITSMNRAAEQAAAETTQLFLNSIKNISVKDAKSILQGGDDSATQYFRGKTSAQLQSVIKPIVSQAMSNTDVTRYYKKLISKADFLGPYIAPESLDLDAYVTAQTVNGLFIKLADEERKIRKDPAARSSELLKQVFGYFKS